MNHTVLSANYTMPFLRKHSDGVTPNEVADNCSLLYSFINPEGMKG